MIARRLAAAAALALASAACQPPGAADADRESYMSSCIVSGGTEAQCACVWEEIATNIPRRDRDALADLSQAELAEHPVALRIAQYAAQCRAAGTAP